MSPFKRKEPEPLKLPRVTEDAPVNSQGQVADYCLACNTIFENAYPRSEDTTICVPCSQLTHFEREMLWVLNRIAEYLAEEPEPLRESR